MQKSECSAPETAEKSFIRGIGFLELGDYPAAEACFRQSCFLSPGSPEPFLNLGYVLDKQGRSAEACACYTTILASCPGNAKARYNRAIHLLRAGDLSAGFADYEARFAAIKSADSRTYCQARWDGSPLSGRSILIYCEQGLGDAIQFIRYVPLVARLGGDVVLEVQPSLVALLAPLPGVGKVVIKSELPPQTDCHIPLLSLPHIFATTLDSIPAQSPPLAADPAKTEFWRQKLAEDLQYKVGLVWRGSATNPMDQERSCTLIELTTLLETPGISFYSLQVGPASGETATLPQAAALVDLAGQLNDFSDTAALVANLDLVITVDTAVAHLAGAMGKPVWVMLAYSPDWRWMRERTDSPWYPTMRLFRQQQPGDWQSVVSEIFQALHKYSPSSSPEALDLSFQNALECIANNKPHTAIPLLRTILTQLPDDPAAWFNLARAYEMAGQQSDSEYAYRQSLLNNPASPACWLALGVLKLKQKAFPDAELFLYKAHNLLPESVDILLSLGSAFSAQFKMPEAFETCRKILALNPDCPQAVYNMGFLQLRSGDYKPGFKNFEARLLIDTFDVDSRTYHQPQWDGSDLNGKSILIYGEQGLGDVIQFARYIPLVAQQGATVIFEVDPPLAPLFKSFPGVDRIVLKSAVPPVTDVYIRTLSLPYLFGTTLETVPNSVPYLFADTAKSTRWERILGPRTGYRVGLAWQGNPNNPRDKERSCPLAAFAPLGTLPDVHFYSLQVGDAAAEAAAFPPEILPLTEFSDLLTDFTETAALIANLDLVICVDTAVAHLAGAMGQNVWVLLPEGSEWRWIQGRSDTPWYPSMRVFEHESERDWSGMVQRVKAALQEVLSGACTTMEQSIETLYAEAATLKESGNLDEAERCFRQIVAICPDLPDPYFGLGVVLQLRKKLPEAISHYCSATSLDPCFVKAHYNLANAYLHTGQYENAIASAQRTILHDPAHADGHWLLGMLLLQSGDFANGWREYEWRWKATGFNNKIPEFEQPRWDGSPLKGKTLLIYMEQGRGDMIQFIRYASLAAASGGSVIACMLPELVPLIATADGVARAVDRTREVLPGFDVHAPVQSLPYLFGTTLETIPQNTPYLTPDPLKVSEWRHIFPNKDSFRIGLAWQGAPTHLDDKNRSCLLRDFALLSNLVDVEYYSLQMGAGAEQINELSQGMTLIDATDQIKDFSDTAAIIAHLDLVISVDTAVAHLAGALGKPVWTLLPFIPEWRWLLERDNSPWYPTMRLFRQTAAGDWQGVFRHLRDELAQMLGSVTALNQLGITLLNNGYAERAERAFARAAACDPESAESHCNQGVALHALGMDTEAIINYELALAGQPDFAGALFNMGNAYLSLHHLEEARACYERVTTLLPNFVAAYLSLGEVGKLQHNFALAREAYQRAVSLAPNCSAAFQGVADIDLAEERFEEAITAYRRASELNPQNATVVNLLGAAYQSNGQLREAEECYRNALILSPEQSAILNNLGVVLDAQGHREEAVSVYRHLLEIDKDYAEGHWNLSVALLALGDYSEGWREFEWRFKKVNPVASRHFSEPLWDGSDLAGKTLLLHAEQGFGDTLQFVRYVPLLAQRGARVIVECQVPALKPLLSSLAGITEVLTFGEPLPLFDCHLPLMSLPRVMDTTIDTIPCDVPYISADQSLINRWKQLVGTPNRFKVGIVWYAKQSQVLNRKRSCPLSFFSPLWDVVGVEFYTLQIGLGSEQLDEFSADHRVVNLTDRITDFADTAAIITNLDLVITIDTAVAHLAGALGARTWVILPCVAEWRWLSQRSDSPWYPTMRLFRQPSHGDWPSLMNTVAAALCDCVHGFEASEDDRRTIPDSPQLLVGLAWAGRQDNLLDWRRSCPFSALAPLLNVPNVRFVVLQPDTDITAASEQGMIDLSAYIHDFEDTAALMAHLDLVISVDTAVAHLAAATGRPTWVLLSHCSEWRWLTGREDSPWYPGMRLFRQKEHGDWNNLIEEVASHLSHFSNNNLDTGEVNKSKYPHQRCSQERQILEQQLKEYQEAAANSSINPDALLNVGAALALLGRYDEAVTVFKHVLELNPEHVAGHLNLAYSLLAIGKYEEGWPHFEWRLQRIAIGILPPWPMLQPDKLGTHSIGTSVLVHCEQGFGDTIQFARFLPLLTEAGYCVVVSCQPPMVALVQSMPGTQKVIPHGEPVPTCDLQVLLLSLPWLFSVNPELLPADIPYFVPARSKVKIWGDLLLKKSSAQ